MASNLPLLEDAAAMLKHLLPEVVFVGEQRSIFL